MPGAKTHDIFYNQLKSRLNSKTLSSYPNYDKYRIFAQGHDFFIYSNFYKLYSFKKLNANVNNAVLLQEYSFPKFVYTYLKEAEQSGTIEDEATRLFIGPGYVMHHILDAYTHPFITYYAGDYTRDAQNKTWMHGIVETLIDCYLMEIFEHKDSKTYPVMKDFEFDLNLFTERLLDLINRSLKEVYGINNGGEIIKSAIKDVPLFMKLLKYDPTGIKKWLFDLIDPILKGTAAFSYHQNSEEAFPFMNFEHEIWLNPVDSSISSTDSFIDLYTKALNDGAKIVDDLESICQKNSIKQDDVYSIIPNISSSHGLECGQPLRIRNKKKW